jgi:TetR/AcrR family transcriptional regulator
MGGTAGNSVSPSRSQRHLARLPRSEAKHSRIVEIAAAPGIAKGPIFQHFGSKDGLFFEVYKRPVRSFPKYLDAHAEVKDRGSFQVLRSWRASTEHLLHDNWIPFRISLLGNYGTDLTLKRKINRFLITEDPYGSVGFVRFGLERRRLRKDMDVEMIVSILDWTMERFQDALLMAEFDPGLSRRQGEMPEKKGARIQQFLDLLQRAIGEPVASSRNFRLETNGDCRG